MYVHLPAGSPNLAPQELLTRVWGLGEAVDPSIAGSRAGCHQGTGELKITSVTVRHRGQLEGGAMNCKALRSGPEVAISFFCLSKKPNRTYIYAT